MKKNKLFLFLITFIAFGQIAWAQDAYTYIDCSWDAENKTVVQTPRAIPLNVTTVNSYMGTFVGWNVVRGNVTINGNVRCRGHVRLILCDNAHLTITGGFTVQREPSTIDSLTIYCQSYGSSMGKLTVTCNTNRYAGIGGGMLTSASVTNGPITIHGGDITTTGGPNGVGLGCRVEYYYGVPSPITIYGGRVEAHGGEKAGSSGEEFGCAGIGLIGRSGSTLNVYGGNVYAYGADDAAGIGGCSGYPISHFGGGEGGTVHIYGGRVEAHGGKYGAGIGGGQNGNGSIVTVHGGSVYAYGGTDAAGIGSGEEKEDAKNGGSLTITGGSVEAHGGKYGAGIGGGQDASGANVTISGGIVNAYGGTDAAGVGSGEEVSAGEGAINGGTLTVTGGYLFADGSDVGCGIGGGQDADGATVNITGGTVVAWCGSGSGTSAIGSNLGDNHRGTLHIGDSLMVHAGQTPTTTTLFPSATRVPACFYRHYARIEPCDHQGATYTVNGTGVNGTHTLHCTHCLHSPTHTHTFNENNVCTVCGVSGSISTVGVYLPVYENNTYSYGSTPTYTAQLVTGSTFELPTPSADHMPVGVRFVGWRVGSPGELGLTDPRVTDGEELLEAGTSYTVTGDISFTPRYKTFHVFTTDGDWNEPANWCWGTVPTADKEIVIAADATIPAEYTAEAYNITIDLGGSITIAAGGQLIHNTDGVEAIVQKNITAYSSNGYYLLTNPVAVEQTPETIGMLENDYDLYGFNQSEELEWRNYEQTPFSLTNGTGYLYANDTVKELVFNGVLNPANVDISVPLTYDANADFAGLNLVGNPFACNAYLLNENNEIMPFFKMSDTGDTLVAAQAGTAIKPCEGVFVVCPNDGQSYSVTFTTTAPATIGEAEEIPSMLLPVFDMSVHQDASPNNDNIIQTIALLQGWNWWSTSLDIDLDQLKNAIAAVMGTDGSATIKSQHGAIIYRNGQWRGTAIESLDLRQMYEIQTSESCEITVMGVPVNPEDYEITISNGNNWIGFLSGTALTLDEAFGTFPVNGDVIESRNNSAVYRNGQWRGQFEGLEPGYGYIYKSNIQGDRTFTYPASSR